MPFRPFKIWASNKLNDPTDRIERHLTDRIKRVIVGIYLPGTFERLFGSLVVTCGRGRYLRLMHFDSATVELPSLLQANLHELKAAKSPELQLLAESRADLADYQLIVADQLKRKAGKYVDRVLAISSYDDGLVISDFDGRKAFQPITDAARLAEQTGLSVIDSFPERDIIANGQGCNLLALPLWLMFADRAERVSQNSRLLVHVHQATENWFLPESDGLDLEVPKIHSSRFAGSHQIRSLLLSRNLPFDSKTITQLYAAGRPIDGVAEKLMSNLSDGDLADDDFLNESIDSADLVRTVVSAIGKNVISSIDVHQPDQVFVCSNSPLRAALLSELQNRTGSAQITDLHGQGFAFSDLFSIGAAMLGMMHIDQMPANIPGLTNANSQRILGRITSGTPTNYRQLLTCMADFSPPAMKLRDAI